MQRKNINSTHQISSQNWYSHDEGDSYGSNEEHGHSKREKRSSRNVTEEEIIEYLAKRVKKNKAIRAARKLKTFTISKFLNGLSLFHDSNLNNKIVWSKKIEWDFFPRSTT